MLSLEARIVRLEANSRLRALRPSTAAEIDAEIEARAANLATGFGDRTYTEKLAGRPFCFTSVADLGARPDSRLFFPTTNEGTP